MNLVRKVYLVCERWSFEHECWECELLDCHPWHGRIGKWYQSAWSNHFPRPHRRPRPHTTFLHRNLHSDEAKKVEWLHSAIRSTWANSCGSRWGGIRPSQLRYQSRCERVRRKWQKVQPCPRSVVWSAELYLSCKDQRPHRLNLNIRTRVAWSCSITLIISFYASYLFSL